jgi:ribosomal protein L23
MITKPNYTEKSLRLAKDGQYTFWVEALDTKASIKSQIAKIFGVHVTNIRVIKKSGEVGKNIKGKRFNKLISKKVVVTLKAGEKLDVFEESKK